MKTHFLPGLSLGTLPARAFLSKQSLLIFSSCAASASPTVVGASVI